MLFFQSDRRLTVCVVCRWTVRVSRWNWCGCWTRGAIRSGTETGVMGKSFWSGPAGSEPHRVTVGFSKGSGVTPAFQALHNRTWGNSGVSPKPHLHCATQNNEAHAATHAEHWVLSVCFLKIPVATITPHFSRSASSARVRSANITKLVNHWRRNQRLSCRTNHHQTYKYYT